MPRASVRQGRQAARLGYPGGPAIEELAQTGDPSASRCRARCRLGDPHFSFAGLKSAVQRAVASGDYRREDIAASFQQAVVDCLVDRTRLALAESDAPALVVAGGVAANQAIRGAWPTRAAKAAASASRRLAVHRQCGDDRLGRRRAPRAGLTDASMLRPRALAARSEAEKVRGAGVKA
jgi:N6-L-threonylcarbamoyladenine synthase